MRSFLSCFIDPFYTAPPFFESAPPGAALRVREAPGNLTSVVANCSKAYHINYRTTDSLYSPAWAVTTLFVPKHPVSNDPTTLYDKNASRKKNALLSYQIPYNTADVDGSPSYGLYSFLSEGSNGIPSSTEDIATALGLGWYVVVPDFEGPLAAFTVGPQAGHAVLDSVRAVFAADAVPLTPANTHAALWGYSGGSIASAFAAEQEGAYAPGLGLAGVAVGGTVPNLTEAMGDINGHPYAGLVVAMLLGATAQEPDARDLLVDSLKPGNASAFLAALHMNVNEVFVAYSGDIGDYFVGGLAAFLGNPRIKTLLGKNAYAGRHGVPRAPVFSYKAIADEFTAIGETDRLTEAWCALGVDVVYQRNTVGGHVAEITNGRPRALAFLTSVLDGSYTPSGCVWQDVTVNLTASAA
ncbi:LIP-domain-containing protein [Xylariaceae sp. FL0662B]|nr:LIP-domain-containing protein [Xylariaceae sp. FL0662B]